MSRTNHSKTVLAGFRGDRAALDTALTDDDPVMRSLALGGLDRLGELTAEILKRALTDADRDVRCRAVELAIPHGTLDLVAMLDDADDLVVETAAWALGERQQDSRSVVTRLIEVAGSHDVSICREAAVAALGAIGHDDGLPAILAALHDRAPVRRRAVLALAPFEGPAVDAALERALTDRDRQVRQAAEDLA